MKLLRYGDAGHEQPGMLDNDGKIRDLSGVVDDINGDVLTDAGLDKLKAVDASSLPQVSTQTRLGPPIANPGKILCIGLNYAKHAKESGMAAPAEPVLFMKSTTSASGPNDNIVKPPHSTKLDWEVELGIVIGKRARYVEETDALDYVAGYCVVNDVSERAFQLDGTGQWVKGKSADTFCPFGPYITTRDEVIDPQTLNVWLDVNGERKQQGNTDDMIFTCAHIISYVSRYMTLEPGDIIPTGTPHGVGIGLKPPQFLQAGDEVRLGIDGLGEIQQLVVKG